MEPGSASRRTPALVVIAVIVLLSVLKTFRSLERTTADHGASLQEFRQLLAHAQHVFPRVRNCIWPAWDLLSKWEKLEQNTSSNTHARAGRRCYDLSCDRLGLVRMGLRHALLLSGLLPDW